MPQTKESFLKGRSTGWLLLKYRQRLQGWHDGFWNGGGDSKTFSVLDKSSQQSFNYSYSEIKAELDKRPHLPTKQELRSKTFLKKRKGKKNG